MHGWGPAEVVRGEDGLPFALKLRRCVRVFDEEGRFAPLYEDGETCEVECGEVVMAAIGQSIDWGGLLDGSAVEVRANGTAVANAATFQTNQPDVFVGGDAFTGPQFVMGAIAAGHEAAVILHRFAQKGSSLVTGRNPAPLRGAGQRGGGALRPRQLRRGGPQRACLHAGALGAPQLGRPPRRAH